ncbi:MAG: hypothetical protein MZV65_06680 [Chromatiales bacterium]|nr:hypothetical protein [Chromatiales bacterium]
MVEPRTPVGWGALIGERLDDFFMEASGSVGWRRRCNPAHARCRSLR